MAKIVVGAVDSLPPGSRTTIEVEGRAIAIFNAAGTFYALRDTCPHMGACLSKGVLVGAIEADRPGVYEYDEERVLVRCPWHGWEYELATGRSWFDPEHNRVRRFEVAVEDGATLLESPLPTVRQPGPYAAETFSISVEDDYVTVEV